MIIQRILAAVIALVLIFNTVGILVIFQVKQLRIRQEMKTLIKGDVAVDQLHRISFKRNEVDQIDWVRKGKEFRYGNLMFDIVRTVIDRNEIHFHCINDVEERALFKDLEELVEQKMSDDSALGKMKGKIAKLIKSFEVILSGYKLSSPDQVGDALRFTDHQNSLTTMASQPPTPPPKTR